AVAGVDFTPVAGTFTFPPGAIARTVQVLLTSDTLDEDDETFTFTLTAPVGATLGSPSVATATILDDDLPPVLQAGDCTGLEGTGPPGSCVLPVTLSAVSGKQVSVSYATLDGSAGAAADYTPAAGVLTFP